MIDRPTWLAIHAMQSGGFTTPEIEEKRYQKDVAAGRLLPNMTSEELAAAARGDLTMQDIEAYRADPTLWAAHYEKRYKDLRERT